MNSHQRRLARRVKQRAWRPVIYMDYASGPDMQVSALHCQQMGRIVRLLPYQQRIVDMLVANPGARMVMPRRHGRNVMRLEARRLLEAWRDTPYAKKLLAAVEEPQ